MDERVSRDGAETAWTGMSACWRGSWARVGVLAMPWLESASVVSTSAPTGSHNLPSTHSAENGRQPVPVVGPFAAMKRQAQTQTNPKVGPWTRQVVTGTNDARTQNVASSAKKRGNDRSVVMTADGTGLRCDCLLDDRVEMAHCCGCAEVASGRSQIRARTGNT